MTGSEVHAWLLQEGGPAIRYRTARELLSGGADSTANAEELLASPMVQTWLARLGEPGGLASFHSSKPEAFENAAAKLRDLGLHAGM
ncbi:MAG: hypothetical protein ACP5JG_16745, partial [Anaerolineae bacterium]